MLAGADSSLINQEIPGYSYTNPDGESSRIVSVQYARPTTASDGASRTRDAGPLTRVDTLELTRCHRLKLRHLSKRSPSVTR